MKEELKYRLTGAIVLVALMIIFVPLLFDGAGYEELAKWSGGGGKRPPITFDQHFPGLNKKVITRHGIPSKADIPPEAEADDKQTSEPQPADSKNKSHSPSAKTDEKANEQNSWLLQAGVFSDIENAKKMQTKLQQKKFTNIFLKRKTVGGKTFHIIYLGPFDTAKAQSIAQELQSKLQIEALLKPTKE